MALGISGYGNYTGYGLYAGYGSASFAVGNPTSVSGNAEAAGNQPAGKTGSGQTDASGKVIGADGKTSGTNPDGTVNPEEDGKSEETTKKPGRRSSPAECETCKNRKYQDGSDEANVSFKAAAHVSPEAAGAAVRAHEGMHVANAYNKAKETGGKVLQASVSIHTAVCPECGRVYVSGGETRTRIATPVESARKQNPYKQNENALNSIMNTGNTVNAGA